MMYENSESTQILDDLRHPCRIATISRRRSDNDVAHRPLRFRWERIGFENGFGRRRIFNMKCAHTRLRYEIENKSYPCYT